MQPIFFAIAACASGIIFPVISYSDQPSGGDAGNRDPQSSEREKPPMELFIDSDNNNEANLPDFSPWETEIKSHEFAIGKVIKVGSKKLVPLVIRINKRLIENSLYRESSIHDHSIAFFFGEPVGKIAIWKTSVNYLASEDLPSSDRLDFGVAYKLRDLNFNAEESQTIVWIEAIESVPHLVTKDDIDRRGRPDLFLYVRYMPRNFSNIIRDRSKPNKIEEFHDDIFEDKVKILPVEQNSFLTTFVMAENRHIRDAVAAGLINGRQWFDGNQRPVMPHESKAYGMRLVTRDELAAMIKTSEPLMSLYSDILFWDGSRGRDPIERSLMAMTGQRVGLYRNWCTGEFTIAIQDFRTAAPVQAFKPDRSLTDLRRFFTPSEKISEIGKLCFWIEKEVSDRQVPFRDLRIVGHSMGGQLAVFGALSSGIEASVFNTEPFQKLFAELALTEQKNPGSTEYVENFPNSLERISEIKRLVEAYSLSEQPFQVIRIGFDLN